LTAECYALVEEKEQAIDWVEQAVRQGFINYPFLSESGTCVSRLRGYPRFDELLLKVKNAWEQFDE
jgi:hypothetical protein